MVKPPLFPKVEGKTSRQAHTNLPEGTIELERGRKGFFGRVSHLYKTNAPTAWTDIKGDLKPRSFNFDKIKNELNFSTKFLAEDGIEEMVKILEDGNFDLEQSNV